MVASSRRRGLHMVPDPRRGPAGIFGPDRLAERFDVCRTFGERPATMGGSPDLGEAAMATPAGEAVVVGAGIAGLAATRVLSDRFARVTLIDRDGLPDE